MTAFSVREILTEKKNSELLNIISITGYAMYRAFLTCPANVTEMLSISW